MARAELWSNPKFKRLVKRLGIPQPFVAGLLETLWHVAYNMRTDKIGDADDVEVAAEWPGKPGEFFAAMLDLRWVDERDGQFYVHDLADHAPDYVKKRLKRVRDDVETRYNNDLWNETDAIGRRTADNGSTRGGNGVLPPSPPPVPSPRPLPPSCEESATPLPAPSVMEFPCVGVGGKSWGLTQTKIDEYAGSFPGCNVLAECRAARQWCIDNPTNRKTFSGMGKFLTAWLIRAQNKGASNGNGTHRPNSNNDPGARRAAQRAQQYDEHLELPPNLLDSADASPRV